MNFRLAAHARERMDDRAITVGQIQAVLAEPDDQYPADSGQYALQKINDGRLIVLIVDRWTDPVTIVTIMVDEK
jgi:hypothetical protein